MSEAELQPINAQPPPSTNSQQAPIDLNMILRNLCLRGDSSPSIKSLDVPKVSSKSPLLSSVPTVEQIEAAAIRGKPENIPNCNYPADQTPHSRSILETLKLVENPPGSPRSQCFDPYPQSSISNWNRPPYQGNCMVNSPVDRSLGDQLLRLGTYERLPNRQINNSHRGLPNDPAIALPFSQRQPIAPSLANFEQSLTVQNQQRQQFTSQQSPFFRPNCYSAVPNSNFHSSPSMEAALSQLKGSLGALQNPSTPPNSLFSSTATLRGAISGNSSSNHLEQLFQPTSLVTAPPIGGFYMTQHPQLRQNGSAPNLLPTVPNPTPALDMFFCNHENSGFGDASFFSRPTTSDLSAMRRKLS